VSRAPDSIGQEVGQRRLAVRIDWPNNVFLQNAARPLYAPFMRLGINLTL
jgi:hypothetical protein